MIQDLFDDGGVFDTGDDLHRAATLLTGFDIDRKYPFEALGPSHGSMALGGESRVLFQALLMLLEVVLAVFMEKITNKDTTNSSKPSSQTEKDDSAINQPGSKGKGN